jgi:hypothetical protein
VWQPGVQLGQAQNLLHLLPDPFVVGKRIGSAGDEQGL